MDVVKKAAADGYTILMRSNAVQVGPEFRRFGPLARSTNPAASIQYLDAAILASTPKDIMDELARFLKSSMAQPAVVKQLTDIAMPPITGTPEDLSVVATADAKARSPSEPATNIPAPSKQPTMSASTPATAGAAPAAPTMPSSTASNEPSDSSAANDLMGALISSIAQNIVSEASRQIASSAASSGNAGQALAGALLSGALDQVASSGSGESILSGASGTDTFVSSLLAQGQGATGAAPSSTTGGASSRTTSASNPATASSEDVCVSNRCLIGKNALCSAPPLNGSAAKLCQEGCLMEELYAEVGDGVMG